LYLTPEEELRDKQNRLGKVLAVSNSPELSVEHRIDALNQMAGNEIRNADMIDAATARTIEAKPGKAEDRAQDGDAEFRAASERAALLSTGAPEQRNANGAEWNEIVPSHKEWRALVATGTPASGGYAVPTGVSRQWIDKLRAQSVFMSAPGLNVIPFENAKFVIPQLSASTDPAFTAEGAVISEGTLTFAGPSLDPIKFAVLYTASSEMIEDSAVNVEDLIGKTMIADLGAKVDAQFFQGTGTNQLAGLSLAANSTTTTLAAGVTAVRWDDIIDAYAAIIATGARPSVVWASPDMWKGLAKARENGTSGMYLSGGVTNDPVSAALGLPLLTSASIPARTVYVAAADRLFCGVRRDITIDISRDYRFNEDVTSYRGTYRIAGVRAAEATSCQRILAAAS
jgi:HK97 family phage major capsid protein